MNSKALLVCLLVLPAPLAWAQRYECATSLGVNCEATIPEKGNLVSTLTVLPGACPASARVVDVDVNVRAVHTMVGDLNLTLVHPSGRAVQFLFRSGLTSQESACVFDDLDATFSDEGDAAPACAFTIPAVSGTLQPFNPLSAFDGLDRNGLWQLQVSDVESDGKGLLEGWSLELPCSLPVVTVSTGERDTVEGSATPATVVFTREGSTDAGLTVRYELSGTAVPGADYEAPSGQVEFTPGSATATLSVRALADQVAETTESVVVTLGQGEFTAGTPRVAGLNLVDVTCGDGLLTGQEECDDGNAADGDGCSAQCALVPVICGDGSRAVTEGCDDGNLEGGDGCSAQCTIEPLPAPAKTGCGCTSVDPLLGAGLLALLIARRRVPGGRSSPSREANVATPRHNTN